MDLDPLTLFQTPLLQHRKVVAVRPSPPRMSGLLAAFGARRSQSSLSRMAKEAGGRDLRPPKPAINFAEPEGSNPTPETSPSKSGFDASFASSNTSAGVYDDNTSEDELQQSAAADESDEGDMIQVAPRKEGRRLLPPRSTRSQVSYAPPKKIAKKKKKSNSKKKKPVKLMSDLHNASTAQPTPQEDNYSKQNTRLKREIWLLANKDYFLPLLPEKNYITKLAGHEQSKLDSGPADVIPHESLRSQPEGVNAIMKPYQLEGLSFLIYMHRNGMPAILGDEMGLGKTLQTLSLFQHLKTNDKSTSAAHPSLVVCPLSVLSSWMNESKKWTPGLRVVRFHGSKTEREKLKEECRAGKRAVDIDIVVTTYESFVSEQNWFKRAFAWNYCVLDEGHKIKNSKSDVSQALHSLRTQHRLLLTGTPLQNNLLEMWALLQWLYSDVFTLDTADIFKKSFDLSKGNVSRSFMDDARRLLEVIMLRRMKTSPGVNLGLPPKEEVLLYVPLTPMQRFWYQRLLTRADKGLLDELFKNAKEKEHQSRQIEAEEDKQLTSLASPGDTTDLDNDVWAETKDIIDKAMQSEEVESKSKWQRLMNLILQLRKVCSHPYILPNAAPEPYRLGDHVTNASGKFIVLDKLINELVLNQGKKVLIFAGLTKTLNLCEDLLTYKGANAVENATFRYVRFDGGTSRARRNLGIRMFNNNDEFKVMLISTRAGGLGINLTSATNVVFMDEDWNPQVMLQAEARAHRIGQTQKVTVFRLCTQGTVEEQMLGRIRKKLYLSTKITESMRNIHSSPGSSKKRKRDSDSQSDEDKPQLDTTSLKSLIRRGAHALARPAIDVTEMLSWDWETTLANCQDKPATDENVDDADEENWLNSMEKVECAVFEGKKHQKELEQIAADLELNHADRRVGMNTTVMVDGFAINKESLNCGNWEAVPTFAGKDPTLQEPKRAKKAPISHQDHCQTCFDGGEVVLCAGCPRAYHIKCLEQPFQLRAKAWQFYCPQHECLDCQAKTSDAGGLIYRCRWCENGFCEDCLDWDAVKLVGDTLMEYEMLGYGDKENAYYIECPSCVNRCENDAEFRASIDRDREDIAMEFQAFRASLEDRVEFDDDDEDSGLQDTLATVSEVGTPVDTGTVSYASLKKKARYS